MAVASVIRGVESSKPYPSKFTLSLGYLVLSAFSLSYLKLKNKNDPEFHLPWMTKKKVHMQPYASIGALYEVSPPVYVFDKGIALVLIIGGVAEFLVSLCVILSFSAALDGNLNQGIGSALMTFNSVIVSAASFVMFREKINLPQAFGILIILVSVILLSVCAPQPTAAEIPAEEADGIGSMLLVIIFGVTGALFFSVESMITKHLIVNKGVAGDVAGITFLFVEGFIGTVCLAVTSFSG